MTGRQSYILGCDFAIHQLTKKGREFFVVYEGNQYIQVAWNDILEWLEKEYNKQEPFINKPCVSSGVCERDKQKVLDKVRAEMLEEMLSHSGTGEEVIQAYADGLKKGLDILDKYKTESEDTE